MGEKSGSFDKYNLEIMEIYINLNPVYSLSFNKNGVMQVPILETVEIVPVAVFLSTVG